MGQSQCCKSTRPPDSHDAPTEDAEPESIDAGQVPDFVAAELDVAEDGEVAADGCEGACSSLVAEALAEAERLMQDCNVVAAEEVLARALARLAEEGSAEDAESAKAQLQKSAIWRRVSARVSQYDAACGLLSATNMQLLYEAPEGKFELFQSDGRWFDFRITMNIDAPLCECFASVAEADLVPQIQTMVSEAPVILGDNSTWCLLRLLGQLDVKVFHVELLLEVLRVPDRKFGFLTENVRTEFPSEGLAVPAKSGWRTIRPWSNSVSLWMPRGGGESGTVLVQVTRVDCPFRAPQWVLDFVFRKMAKAMMADLHRGAMKALEPGSPWAQRIAEDRIGMYRELRELEATAQQRQAISAQALPGESVFNRPWRLWPTPLDTRPPSSR